MNARLTPMLGGLVLTAVALAGCGSSYSNPMSPSSTLYASPSPTPTPTPVAVDLTIRIVGMNADKSFTPNPSSVAAGQTVAFYNADTIVHSIVADDGSFSTANLAPGATSAPIAMPNTGTFGYHSAAYPAMVGTLNVTGH